MTLLSYVALLLYYFAEFVSVVLKLTFMVLLYRNHRLDYIFNNLDEELVKFN